MTFELTVLALRSLDNVGIFEKNYHIFYSTSKSSVPLVQGL